jgi:ATP-dependent DNA helicase DinG
VLLGVASFWQGIDVPGESLTGLLIDKIPFPVPTDPIQSAIGDYIQRQGGNPFFDRSIPQATIALSQGIGRLIRTKKDKGIVMILDKRLITKGYGTGIVRALPRFRKVRSLEAAEGFLEDP